MRGAVLPRVEPERLRDLAVADDARLVVVRQFSDYLMRDVWYCYVATGDLLWDCGCASGHRSEEAAAKCVRGRVRRQWRRRMSAQVALVNGHTTVEWAWPHPSRAGSVEFHRARPMLLPDYATLIDYGPV